MISNKKLIYGLRSMLRKNITVYGSHSFKTHLWTIEFSSLNKLDCAFVGRCLWIVEKIKLNFYFERKNSDAGKALGSVSV